MAGQISFLGHTLQTPGLEDMLQMLNRIRLSQPDVSINATEINLPPYQIGYILS